MKHNKKVTTKIAESFKNGKPLYAVAISDKGLDLSPLTKMSSVGKGEAKGYFLLQFERVGTVSHILICDKNRTEIDRVSRAMIRRQVFDSDTLLIDDYCEVPLLPSNIIWESKEQSTRGELTEFLCDLLDYVNDVDFNRDSNGQVIDTLLDCVDITINTKDKKKRLNKFLEYHKNGWEDIWESDE